MSVFQYCSKISKLNAENIESESLPSCIIGALTALNPKWQSMKCTIPNIFSEDTGVEIVFYDEAAQQGNILAKFKHSNVRDLIDDAEKMFDEIIGCNKDFADITYLANVAIETVMKSERQNENRH